MIVQSMVIFDISAFRRLVLFMVLFLSFYTPYTHEAAKGYKISEESFNIKETQ